jgi:hypothetical protein
MAEENGVTVERLAVVRRAAGWARTVGGHDMVLGWC